MRRKTAAVGGVYVTVSVTLRAPQQRPGDAERVAIRAVRLQVVRRKLAEVAQLAEASEATVSRVLNGRLGVADATRRRVLDVMGDLGYRDVPSLAGRSEAVGIVTPELGNQSLQSHLANRGFLLIGSIGGNGVSQIQVFAPELVVGRSTGPVRETDGAPRLSG